MTVTIEQYTSFLNEYRDGIKSHPCYNLLTELSEKHEINFLDYGTRYAECFYIDKNELIDEMNCILWVMHYNDPGDYEDIERVLNEELDKAKGA